MTYSGPLFKINRSEVEKAISPSHIQVVIMSKGGILHILK